MCRIGLSIITATPSVAAARSRTPHRVYHLLVSEQEGRPVEDHVTGGGLELAATTIELRGHHSRFMSGATLRGPADPLEGVLIFAAYRCQ
jgi:hypothetical protein